MAIMHLSCTNDDYPELNVALQCGRIIHVFGTLILSFVKIFAFFTVYSGNREKGIIIQRVY
jgi:hypothetical protein